MRSEEVREKLRWLAKSQTAIRQDCSDSASGGRCDYCQNPISVGEMECVITGRFRGHHAFLIWQLLAHLDYLDEAIGILSGQVETVIAPFADALTRLDSIPGINQRTAEVIIAEIGVDMSAFPSAGHLASWAALCPGNNESAGKHKSGKPRKGRPLAAHGAYRSGRGVESGKEQRATGAIPTGAPAPRSQESRRGGRPCSLTRAVPCPRGSRGLSRAWCRLLRSAAQPTRHASRDPTP